MNFINITILDFFIILITLLFKMFILIWFLLNQKVLNIFHKEIYIILQGNRYYYDSCLGNFVGLDFVHETQPKKRSDLPLAFADPYLRNLLPEVSTLA